MNNIASNSLPVFNEIVLLAGLSVRSTYWNGEKILVGTNAGEIFEVLATEKDKPKTIVQVGILKDLAEKYRTEQK